MNEKIDSEERSYWRNEVLQRSVELTAMQEQDADAHVVAGAELRLREAQERLAAMPAKHT